MSHDPGAEPGDQPSPSQSDVHVRRFNESFYASDPGDYLLTRLHLMFLAASKRNELAELLDAGGEYAGVTIAGARNPDRGTSDDGDNGRDLDRFLVVESQQLLHHACETALRLFYVHAAVSNVPWVELAGFRNFRQFKDQVRKTFIANSPPRGAISWVCLGSEAPNTEHSEEKWADALDGLIAFFREFAERTLDDANLYNSTKHGLGVSAGDAIFSLEGQTVGSGPSIEFPESGDWEGNKRTWSLTTVWPDITESIGLTYVAIQMISSMWRIGRHRYTGTDLNGPLYFPAKLRPKDLRGRRTSPAKRMSWRMIEELR